jgi:uncharacterized membrane protein YoaK (UPF0700 family)
VERHRQRKVRDILVVMLTVTTGAVDAVSILHLIGVFSSVITGNIALFGVATGVHSGTLAVHGGVALAGYAAGVVAAAPISAVPAGQRAVWPARVTAALAVEFALLAALSVGWVLAAGRPAGTVQLTLLALAAAAMGMQSTAVRRLSRMSSTYLTSTLTGVVAALAVRERPEGLGRSLGSLAALAAGAAAGALASAGAVGWVPAVLLGPFALVMMCSLSIGRPAPTR